MDQRQPTVDPQDGVSDFERLISDLSTRFINLKASEFDAVIGEALRRLSEYLGVDRSSLWQGSDTAPGAFNPTHVYFRDERARSEDGLTQDRFPWISQEVLAGRAVILSSIEDLPKEAVVDLESAHRLGLRSSIILPLSVGGETPLGLLSLSTQQTHRAWPEATLRQLRLLSQMLANAIARRRYERALQESEERLSLAADAAGAGLWRFDYGSGTFWMTPKARTIFQIPPADVVDLERLEALVHPEDRGLVRSGLQRSVREGEELAIEYRVMVPDERRMRWLTMRGRPHSGSSGDIGHLTGAVFDVTDQKRGEAALRRSEARLAASADLAGLAHYEADFREGEIFVDERFCALLGFPVENAGGLRAMEFWMEHIHPDDRPGVMEIRRQLHEGKIDRLLIEYRFHHPTRGEIWIHHLSRVTRRVEGGAVATLFGVMRDITERRRREQALQESHAEITLLKERLQAESDYLRAEIGAIRPGAVVTGESPAIQNVLRLLERVAPTDSSVLIHGETGTGKELVAQALHHHSPRKSRLMVTLNCAALPSGLVESELFGRERGAFTGALTRQIGRFELADHSTLFLDEIGELSLEVQAKLLRVLESGEFERLGNPRTVKADVRVIAATNRDLAEEVKKGRFREDLYYRLNVFPIRVPPLRERVEDIPLLVWTFLEEFSSRMGKKITKVSRNTMDSLVRHRWPGNVRELRNVIEHAAILTSGDTLKVDLLGATANTDAPPPKLIDSERELILRALESTGWHVKGPKGAANMLGLNPSTLYSRMKKLGLKPPRPARGPSA